MDESLEQPLAVLLADHNQDSRSSFRDAIARAGIEVATASSSRAAIAAARSLAPRVIIWAIGMPGFAETSAVRDGREHTEGRLRESEPGGGRQFVGHARSNSLAIAKKRPAVERWERETVEHGERRAEAQARGFPTLLRDISLGALDLDERGSARAGSCVMLGCIEKRRGLGRRFTEARARRTFDRDLDR